MPYGGVQYIGVLLRVVMLGGDTALALSAVAKKDGIEHHVHAGGDLIGPAVHGSRRPGGDLHREHPLGEGDAILRHQPGVCAGSDVVGLVVALEDIDIALHLRQHPAARGTSLRELECLGIVHGVGI